ncbi:MAG: hypothetical protein ACI8TA_003100, partial [Cyclobacteriaceae bacterium]
MLLGSLYLKCRKQKMTKIKMKSLTYILLIFSIPTLFAQQKSVTISGEILDKSIGSALPYVTVLLKTEKDGLFISGTISDESGRFSLSNITPGDYELEISFVGYTIKKQSLFVG